jgi:hypothetical protein
MPHGLPGQSPAKTNKRRVTESVKSLDIRHPLVRAASRDAEVGYTPASVPLPFSLVIAGLDPAIHADEKLDRIYRQALGATPQHGPPGQARW